MTVRYQATRTAPRKYNIDVTDLGLCQVTEFNDGEKTFYAIVSKGASHEERMRAENNVLFQEGYTNIERPL